MARVAVAVAADDAAVRAGLSRLFGRMPEFTVADVASGAPDGVELDLLVLDIWPPAPGRAEALCARWHLRQPGAAIIAVVHHPSPGLLQRVRRAGGTALWPKGDMRELPAYALDLIRQRALPEARPLA